ncbi:MAG: DUF134 domain-containing protein [Eubacterium sp.]|nr:DUF134 domain-containing protein [Eubacterium sp.]
MSRKPRSRSIYAYPDFWTFGPEETPSDTIIMTLDEYEAIRLIDKEGKTQEECAVLMNVARTTVTNIYDSARRKIADAIVEGKRLEFKGGAYQISRGSELTIDKKGSNIMRVAVTYEDGQVFQHFGHTEQFKVYDIQDGNVINSQVIDTNGQGHGALAGFLSMAEVDTLICGGIGMGAQRALAEAGVKLYGGVQGNADDAVNALISGNLDFDPDARCDHHGEGHSCGGHGEGHSCGGHGEGHSCGHHE